MNAPDAHGNRVAREGVDRCECGCKYWENDRCIDCGAAPRYTPRPDEVVTGLLYGGTRRLTVVVTSVDSPEVVVGRLCYASTFTPGGRYEGCFRGIVALDPTTVRPR